jgi:hypothetical protein
MGHDISYMLSASYRPWLHQVGADGSNSSPLSDVWVATRGRTVIACVN